MSTTRKSKRAARRAKVETLEIIEGVLYKASGAVVDVTPKDKYYRKAYHKMHLKLFAPLNIWPPDGVYVISDGKMKPMVQE